MLPGMCQWERPVGRNVSFSFDFAILSQVQKVGDGSRPGIRSGSEAGIEFDWY
jgi:hypothetical protein